MTPYCPYPIIHWHFRIDAKMAEQQTQISRDIFRHLRIGDSKDVFKFIDSHAEMDINVRNEDSETMLIYCVKRLGKKWTLPFGGEYAKICESLIKRNIDVNLQDLTGNTAAHCAVDVELVEVLKMLLRNGARLGIRRTDSLSALDLIAEKGDLDWTRGIFAETVTVEEHIPTVEEAKCALFHRFLSTNHLPCIQWICRHYPELMEATNEASLTSVHVAVTENNVPALDILLHSGANTEAVDNEGHTPLHFAVVYGHKNCLLALLSNRAEVNCRDFYQRTPLHFAVGGSSDNDVKSSKISCVLVEYLLNCDASMTLVDSGGRLPLHWAASTGNTDACDMMISSGCPVNRTCNEGLTALHTAASEGHEECIRVLVMKGGADVNSPDKTGHSPLFYAINMELIDCAELLLYHGASPNNCNEDGESPAHFAATKGLTSALEILHKYKGSFELEDMEGNRPLHKAALNECQDAVDYMLKCKCRVDVRNKEGFTPLHLATSSGAVDVCNRLLEGGASVNDILIRRKNAGVRHFLTALDIAYLNNELDCQQLLKSAGGIQGRRIADRAARNIQKCWRKNRRRIVHKEANGEQYIKTNSIIQVTETDAKHEEIENEHGLTIDMEVRLHSNEKFESNGRNEESYIQNERSTKTVSQEGKISKDDEQNGEVSDITTSNSHDVAEQIQVLENDGSSKASNAKKGKSKLSTKKSTITVNKSLLSTATQGSFCDKRDSSIEENQSKKSRLRLPKVTKGSSNGRCKTGSSPSKSPELCKTKSEISKNVKRSAKVGQLAQEAKKVSGSTERKNTKLPEIKDVVTASPKDQRFLQGGSKHRKIKPTRQSSRSCEEKPYQKHEQRINESLNVEISRTEKLSQDVCSVKKGLDKRCDGLEERLKEIELKLSN